MPIANKSFVCGSPNGIQCHNIHCTITSQTGYCVAQQIANCFSGGACRNSPISFGIVEHCCNSSDILRSFSLPGSEQCDDCRCKYI